MFSFDEKSQIQALQRAQPILPMDLGQWERQTHNYIRHGTLAFLNEIEASVDASLEIHVVLDNLSAHNAPAVHRWLLRHPRVRFHFTPTYS